MKGLDTNVLIRYIVQDDPVQSKVATQFIERECTIETPGFINGVVICELVWVLESAYEYPRHDICRVVEQILRTREFHIHEPELIWQSLWGYQQKGADFADHFIASINAHHGCDFTATFDKKATRAEHFRQLK